MVAERTVSLSLVRVDVLSLIKELDVLFSHKNISWNNLVSVLMDSCNVTKASKLDLKKPSERQSVTSHLVTAGNCCHSAQNTSEEQCTSHLKCTFLQMHNGRERHQKGFTPLSPHTPHRQISLICHRRTAGSDIRGNI